MAQLVKNLLAMQETQVRSLGGEDSPGGGNGFLLWQEAIQKQVLSAYEAGLSGSGLDCLSGVAIVHTREAESGAELEEVRITL